MFSLLTHCSVCLNEGPTEGTMYKATRKDIDLINRLSVCKFKINWLDCNTTLSICNSCYIRLQIAYDFIELCRKNSLIVKGYVLQVNHTADSEKNISENEQESDDEDILVVEEMAGKQHELKSVINKDSKEISQIKVKQTTEVNGNSSVMCAEIDQDKNAIRAEPELEINGTDISVNEESMEVQKERTPESCTSMSQDNLNNNNKLVKKSSANTNSTNTETTINNEEEEEAENLNEGNNNIEIVLLQGEPVDDSLFLQEEHFLSEEHLFPEEPEHDSLFLQEEHFETEEHLMANTKSDDTNIALEPGQRSSSSSENDAESANTPANNKNRIKCTVCKKQFTAKSKFLIHMRTHTGEKPFACQFCEKRYTRVENLNEHMLTHGEKPFKCTRCDKSFLFRKNFKAHKLSHIGGVQPKPVAVTDETVFKCSLCKKCFESELFLLKHMSRHDEATYKCSVCDGLFKNKQELDTHRLDHSGTEIYKCSVCHKEYDTSGILRRHMRTHPSGNAAWQCTACSKTLATEKALQRHMLLHIGEEPPTCTVCAEKFLFRHQLHEHMLMHKGREFSCVLCEKIFNTRPKLNRHIKTHTQGKVYECAVCNKRFASEEYLKSHQAFHSGEKPFECLICHKKFTIRQTLYNHKLHCTAV